MIDPEQNKEPVFYGIDQMQRTNQNQLMQIEERHGDLQRLEVSLIMRTRTKSLFYYSERYCSIK